MKIVTLAGGRVTLTFDPVLTYTQRQETLAVPYATATTVAPVTAADCVWEAAPGAPVRVAIALPAPVCGLGECLGLLFWFSRVRSRPLMTTDLLGVSAPDLGLCVQDGVLFSGAGVAV